MRYPVEQFSAEEQALLAPHFTNLDRPVFALVNLPGDGEGGAVRPLLALRGQRSRLFLEEFAADVGAGAAALRR